MTYEKRWIDCPCGESIAASETLFAQAVVTAWREQHADHEPAVPERIAPESMPDQAGSAGTEDHTDGSSSE